MVWWGRFLWPRWNLNEMEFSLGFQGEKKMWAIKILALASRSVIHYIANLGTRSMHEINGCEFQFSIIAPLNPGPETEKRRTLDEIDRMVTEHSGRIDAIRGLGRFTPGRTMSSRTPQN